MGNGLVGTVATGAAVGLAMGTVGVVGTLGPMGVLVGAADRG